MPNYEFECTDSASAYAEIIADFTKIRNMGFNCIRTSGWNVNKLDTDSVGIIGFYQTCYENVIPIDTGDVIKVSISPPYSSDSFIQNTLFPGIELILQAARTCSLKVILDCGYGDIALDPAGVDAADYAGYLSVLADRFKNDTTLIAYVTIEEPEWSSQGGLHKEKACEYTSLWYNAITTADTNHLVTIGGCGYWGAFYWDLSVLKMDFYSAHIYPYNMVYENYDTDTLFLRWKGALLWMHKNCPSPWIIGETGFSAISDEYWNYNVVNPPLTNGDLTEQADYAQNSLAAVRDCGGSGYSWWNYQENWWNSAWEDGYGLLKHGALDTIDKPAVSVFENYPSPPPDPQQCDYPSNYYDPNNWDHYCPPPCLGWYKKVHGTITETGTTNPIVDAVIGAWTWYKKPPPNDSIFSSSTHTFTDTWGSYGLNPQYPNSYISGYYYIGITAAGADTHWPPGSSVPQPPWLYNDSLNYTPFKYDLVINNETVTFGNNRNFQGWSTLTVNTLSTSNVVVQNGAISEFKARDGVTINGDFTAALGSDVTIYCTETFPECKDYTGYKSMTANNPVPDKTPNKEANYEKQMEVKFVPIKEYAFLDVYPNPGNGLFTLNLRTNKEDNNLIQIHVYDITGSCIYKGTINENISNLNLSFLSKGIYYLQASTNDDSFNQKLIIK